MKRIGYPIGNHVQFCFIAVILELGGNHGTGAVDVANVSIEPGVEQMIDAITNKRCASQVGIVGHVFWLEMESGRNGNLMGAPPVSGFCPRAKGKKI